MPIVVKRPEPVDDEAPPARAKLTPEEIRALLAVEGANRPSTTRALWRRGRVVAVPTGLISLAAHLFFGSWAPFVAIAAIVAAITWMAWPLLRRDGWD